jgi:hypothetical protein
MANRYVDSGKFHLQPPVILARLGPSIVFLELGTKLVDAGLRRLLIDETFVQWRKN